MYYAKEIADALKNSRQLVIFGAGGVAQNVIYCLTQKPYELHIDYCLVSDTKKNPKQLLGVPVIDFMDAEEVLTRDALVVIAALDKNIESIEEILHQHRYFHTISFGYEGDLWSWIRGNYYRECRLSQGKAYLTLDKELEEITIDKEIMNSSVSIYTAKCHVDKKINEDTSRYSWEIPIQVGAELADEKICTIRDNMGENISNKNRQYCELTALYWIWKNDNSDYVGLCHYRRHFEVTKEMLQKLAFSDIDVVLTIPILDVPNVGEVYRRDHVGQDWDVMLMALKELSPEYLDAALRLQDENFYYAYNMFIMRKQILKKYCGWLFPILFYCEEHCQEKEDTYQNRYIGFLAEHLLSIYFMYHEEEFKIVHADKHFIEK